MCGCRLEGRAVPWLTREDQVLASVEVRRQRGRELDTVVVLRRPTIVHALGSGRLDVAWCRNVPEEPHDTAREVVEVKRTMTLSATRPIAPGFWMAAVIVASAGSFERWRLRAGDRLTITGD
jgi:hypothetical protein